jgi:poly(A) polymerase
VQPSLHKAVAIISIPKIIPRAEHTISRSNISEGALKVLYRLKNAGYQAYLVGGGVRDVLLGREPKDFDVATNALPEQVREQFRNCHLIGRRFRLAHVRVGADIIEVATFRAAPNADDADAGANQDTRDKNNPHPTDGDTCASGSMPRAAKDGRIMRDNVYGSVEEDAWRRDFTINALYYNIDDFSLVDYTGGLEDLNAGRLRLIGDPEQRYREDPVRMLRAVRFAAKLGFRIDPDSAAPLFKLGYLLDDISSARLYDETLKLFMGGYAVQTFQLLRHYGLFGHLFPYTEADLAHEESHFPLILVTCALTNTDARIAAGKTTTPAFLYAALLWGAMRTLAHQMQVQGMNEAEALQEAGNVIVARQVQRTALPKRFSLPMREIWNLQLRLTQITGKRPFVTLTHPRFRAAYDFMLLRAEAGEEIQELCDWWTRFQIAEDDEQQGMVNVARTGTVAGTGKKRTRRSRSKSGKAVSASQSGDSAE